MIISIFTSKQKRLKIYLDRSIICLQEFIKYFQTHKYEWVPAYDILFICYYKKWKDRPKPDKKRKGRPKPDEKRKVRHKPDKRT